jgi:cation transport ATPase
MALAAAGFILPAAGAILQEGIDLLVIFNALRAGYLPASSADKRDPGLALTGK